MLSKIALSIVVVAGAVSGKEVTPTEQYEQLMKNTDRTWDPVHPSKDRFAGWTQGEKKSIMGLNANKLQEGTNKKNGNFRATKEQLKAAAIPTDWDSRNSFGSCMGAIRDQARCGSCWAFGGSETLSDNLCIGGTHSGPLSAQDLVSCDTADHGCNGGDLIDLWNRLDSTGIVDQSCMPYTAFNGTVDACPGYCPGGGQFTRYKCPQTHNMLDDELSIKNGVMQFGSAETGFYVYNDFTTYSGGIYKHDNTTSNFPLGGHAVKIIGWGQAGSIDYWRVANSWGSSWGESGYFRIDMSDKMSDFAIGGAFNCGHLGPTPAPPTPAPQCKNILPDDQCSSDAKDCQVRHGVCAKACKCCDYFSPPAYCNE